MLKYHLNLVTTEYQTFSFSKSAPYNLLFHLHTHIEIVIFEMCFLSFYFSF